MHEDSVAQRRMAVFDVVVNNADRKGGHVLEMTDGHRYGVDHGVTFHTDHKLRTVLWGWLDEPLTEAEVAAVSALRAAVGAELGAALAGRAARSAAARSTRTVTSACGPTGSGAAIRDVDGASDR